MHIRIVHNMQAILAIGVLFFLSTNHIIIYNEEVLIALSFFGFVYCIQRWFAHTIYHTLEEREASLQRQFEALLSKKEGYLTQALDNEKKKAERKEHVRQLIALSCRQIDAFGYTCEHHLPKVLKQNLYQRLDILREARFSSNLHAALVHEVRNQLKFYLYASEGRGLRTKEVQKRMCHRLLKLT